MIDVGGQEVERPALAFWKSRRADGMHSSLKAGNFET